MAFMLSPGVLVTEKDFTNVVPSVSTSAGAYAGVFRWGPVMDPVIVTSENELVQKYGGPNNGTAMSFFSAANYLAYSSNLLLTRVDTAGNKNAVTEQTGSVISVTVSEQGEGYTTPVITIGAPQIEGGVQATAVAVLGTDADIGKIVSIVITESGSGYTSAPSVTITDTGGTPTVEAVATSAIQVSGIKINNFSDYETTYINGAGVVGEFAAKYPGTLGNSLTVSMADGATYEDWAYKAEFTGAPSSKEVHIIVLDRAGTITGTVGAVLEKFAFLGKASNFKRDDGTNSYYKFVLNNSSRWVYWMDHPVGMDWGKEDGVGVTFTALVEPIVADLSGGVDDFAYTEGNIQDAYYLYRNVETYDISLIVAGRVTAPTATFIINNVAEHRKDCMVFVSPIDTITGEPIIGSGTAMATKVVAFRNLLPSTSYAVLDSGFKYQYDRYNDVFRWVPLNGDVAGLCARTDLTDDPWFSPGGYTRGQVKNVVKLSYNPDQTGRDILYSAGVNPVVSFAGQGTLLYGDKTLYAKPSAFDRINVRRLFIVLEKAISTASKYQLFEFNDQFTRAQFRSMVEPFLRDVQGRRGITDFRVVCDESNNNGEIIDTNRFVADIYIKPSRSINFVSLNFIAARTGVAFEEIGG
jgi:hypothetical protein